ncbi:MAG: SagB/ThcOx family dehydrogenase [Bacillota bacterium]
MPSDKVKQLIQEGRQFLKSDGFGGAEATDQQLKIPQPPLTKGKMASFQIDLPINFNNLKIDSDILKVINQRQSHRVYTKEKMTLLQLSYLLWTTQGIKSIRGNQYATIRTVPSGGARHEFETYLVIKNIEGLNQGSYHYLPKTHQIEFLSSVENMDQTITYALSGQNWTTSANVIFFWSVIPYRSEWRYSFFAHRIILVDIGHVCQNLYIACESIGLGTCAIGAFERNPCDLLFGLDGKEEFTILVSPVGTVSMANQQKENDFYSFLKKED